MFENFLIILQSVKLITKENETEKAVNTIKPAKLGKINKNPARFSRRCILFICFFFVFCIVSITVPIKSILSVKSALPIRFPAGFTRKPLADSPARMIQREVFIFKAA